ncbi:hypothetical protein M422DRAFT_264310 [Sphaerobolus stellatus SS14]|uniref:Uncharacterized protein n=1 Tax=Sphaerobolus stellatus (strain SS14) TaxID=990650 RepID=A0A0C9UWN7_SPHS4|nr:hypothetical protein M422DRAFT_264310 [Sphaerobolus stellatus SS14]
MPRKNKANQQGTPDIHRCAQRQHKHASKAIALLGADESDMIVASEEAEFNEEAADDDVKEDEDGEAEEDDADNGAKVAASLSNMAKKTIGNKAKKTKKTVSKTNATKVTPDKAVPNKATPKATPKATSKATANVTPKKTTPKKAASVPSEPKTPIVTTKSLTPKASTGKKLTLKCDKTDTSDTEMAPVTPAKRPKMVDSSPTKSLSGGKALHPSASPQKKGIDYTTCRTLIPKLEKHRNAWIMTMPKKCEIMKRKGVDPILLETYDGALHLFKLVYCTSTESDQIEPITWTKLLHSPCLNVESHEWLNEMISTIAPSGFEFKHTNFSRKDKMMCYNTVSELVGCMMIGIVSRCTLINKAVPLPQSSIKQVRSYITVCPVVTEWNRIVSVISQVAGRSNLVFPSSGEGIIFGTVPIQVDKYKYKPKLPSGNGKLFGAASSAKDNVFRDKYFAGDKIKVYRHIPISFDFISTKSLRLHRTDPEDGTPICVVFTVSLYKEIGSANDADTDHSGGYRDRR